MPKKIQRNTLDLIQIAKLYSDEDAAYEKMEQVRWKNGVVCPHCGAIDKAYFLEPQNGARKTSTGNKSYQRLWKCAACREKFSVLVGTIFEDSKLPLSKWLMAIHLMSVAKNGVSSLELARVLGVTQKSAWHLAHRIREAMKDPAFITKLRGIIEADETYVGGEAANMHKSKREQKIKGRGTVGKVPVLSIIQRGGDVRSQKMLNVTGDNVLKALQEHVDPTATLNTDTLPVYQKAGQQFASHETVDHSADEYVRKLENGEKAHINTAEGYFAQFKRSINGTYHHVSEKHLDLYLAEFDFRYNTRKVEDGARTLETIGKAHGKRLMYEDLIKSEDD